MIGIIGAMEEEVIQIVNTMTDVKVVEIAGMKFNCGKLYKKDLVVVKSGIGKVNAAMCTQILVTYFKIQRIINTGIAGALNNIINIGDVVVSTDTLQHDMDAIGFGYEPGVIPRMECSIFPADSKLIELAIKAGEIATPDIQIIKGRVVSGDQFITSHEKKEYLIKQFSGFCTEMEGAAIGQVAYLNKIPFIILRAISDKADDSASMDYGVFEKKAIDHSIKLLKYMIQNI